MKGGGVGVADDIGVVGEGDDCRYKAFGEGQFLGTTEEEESVKHGIGCSLDGLVWRDGQTLTFPDPQRYDTHNNVQFHEGSKDYLYTTRAGFSDSPGRCAGAAMGENGAFSKYDVDFDSFETTEKGSSDAQIYAQLPFAVNDIYLAHSMVFDAEDSENGRVHCFLSWSPDGLNDWEFVEGDEHGPRDFIPLGDVGDFDSNVCFASTQPFVDNITGLTSVYYIGGNGPHNGDRNSSLGLATLETFDRFAGIGGSGGNGTVAVFDGLFEVDGELLVVTADSLVYGGDDSDSYVRVGVECDDGCDGLGAKDATKIMLGEGNATDTVVEWASGKTIEDLKGKKVKIQVEVGDAILYSIGFQ